MAALHPQIVHITIVLTFVGVAFRLLSLLGKRSLSGPAATLLIIGGLSGLLSARSGLDAHGPVERVPGARAAVQEHEEWGVFTHYVLGGLAAIELLGLAMRRSPHLRKIHLAAALVGVGAVYSVYETGQHGGALVYEYAGGVGIRGGNPEDTERLLMAGYYHQAMADRKAGRPAEAAALIGAAARRFPGDPEVQTLAAESALLDGKDPRAALDALAAVQPGDKRFLRVRVAGLQADAYLALNQKDKAIGALEALVAQAPNPRVQQRIDALKAGKTP